MFAYFWWYGKPSKIIKNSSIWYLEQNKKKNILNKLIFKKIIPLSDLLQDDVQVFVAAPI